MNCGRVQNGEINLMHLVWGLGTGGMENTLINVCNRLPRGEFAPSICVFESGGPMESRVDAERVELIHVRRHFGNDPTLPLRLARELRRRRIHILQTNMWATLIEGIVAAKLARVPMLIHEEHGTIETCRRRVVAQRWGWGRADQVVAVSAALADRMTDVVGFPRDGIHVINNSVDTERFRPSGVPRCELRRQLHLPPNGLLIGMVARFVGFKNHAGVLDAVAKLRAVGIQTELVLVGSGPLRGELAQLANTLRIADCVHFLGELDGVERLLHALDVFVSNSSHNEGLSLSLLEAMACEVPVVATRVAGHPDVLDEGRAGVLIPPQDTGALMGALRQLALDPALRSSLGGAGRRRVVDHYAASSMVEAYRQLYTRLARSPGNSPACKRKTWGLRF